LQGKVTMCIAAYFHVGSRLEITNFSQSGAKLPIITKSGRIALIRWGRRDAEPGALPFGGWASQESLEQGVWNKHTPQLVQLPVLRFIDINYDHRCVWVDVLPEYSLAGLFIQHGKEKRVYVITAKPNPLVSISNKWPKMQKSLYV
jgi:hypothetical protein